MKLYEISEQYAEVQRLIESDDSESMAEAVRETMDLIEGDFQEKASSVVLFSRNIEADVAAIEQEIERLQSKKKSIQNKVGHLRDYLKTNMAATGISNIKCPLFSITLSKPAKQVEVGNEGALPDEFVRVKTTVTPDRAAIAKALKAGQEVPGACLVDGPQRLTIK